MDDVSGNERPDYLREKLRQARIPEVQSGARAFVDFPADRDPLRLPSQDQQDIARELAAKAGQAQRRVRVMHEDR